ncbi:dUTP diphosphatase [Laetiporus sulphureus 93-53]|uniref:Deoxyuridine 5'-triphosphate nucleotidohydrolase n=1 Tax=Laetiporus sulphureus 93-53 TaxID=1314785 RepID=A0A165ECJ9_9APHY|nr:dUTP diphosphatase [Laetiporus sulphureus 93-53]KZT06730.1 dUTP diphosphatase [Laetiporus sulphureus 93-53]
MGTSSGAHSNVTVVGAKTGSRDDGTLVVPDRARPDQEASVLNSVNSSTSNISSVPDSLRVEASTTARRTPKKKAQKTTLHVFLDHPQAIVPTRQTEGAAGYDLHSAEEVVIPGHSRLLVDTGLKLMIPSGCYGRIAPRSGLAVKHGIDVGAGVIDSDYVGRVKILLINTLDTPFQIEYGDRVAQLILERNDTPITEVVTEIAETTRGTAGFGSTGTKLRGQFNVRAVR